jgi:hypothetical protein
MVNRGIVSLPADAGCGAGAKPREQIRNFRRQAEAQ